MTFSAQIKEELASVEITSPECALAECCGMIFFANSTTGNRIKIVTENNNVARRASRLLKTLFGFDFDKKIIPESTFKKYNLLIENPTKIAEIFDAFGLVADENLSIRLNGALVESDEARSAFCRGAFLTAGSVASPTSHYHLELVTSHATLSREVVALLYELNLPAKHTLRKSNSIIYFKESGHIEDFLTRIGAPLSALELMQEKLLKDVRNNTNRQVNCDLANLARAADAAKIHIAAINKLYDLGMIETLSPQLQAAAILRLRYPDASLSELVALAKDGVGKSGLNHRLKKLVSLAEELDKRKDNE